MQLKYVQVIMNISVADLLDNLDRYIMRIVRPGDDNQLLSIQ